jgi:pyruvate kinase
MDVARINFSHGTHDEHATRISSLRRLADRLGQPLAILQDLQGPKIRVGELDQPIRLDEGQSVHFYIQDERRLTTDDRFWIPADFPELFMSVSTGDRILLDDGRISLIVTNANQSTITAQVKNGGLLSSHKGINLPGVPLNISSFTDKDASDLDLGLSMGVDFVAISFVQSADDVLRVRKAIEVSQLEFPPALIAKLERPRALENLVDILAVADGVMVARGDLGVEMPPEEVPLAQKRIIQEANRLGKIVITATQMLESMLHEPLPTRAEASDVANAILDGTDAAMLSGETAVGAYPVESVEMMNRIICKAEAGFGEWGHLAAPTLIAAHDDAASLARAARELARDRDVAAIAVFTRSGRTAALMAKARPSVPILACTPEAQIYQRMALNWGVIPHRVPFTDTVEGMIAHVESALKATRLVEKGSQVVLIAGFPVGAMRPPNMALLHTVG